MNTQLKEVVIEKIVGRIMHLEDLSKDKYLELKEARISDAAIHEYFGTHGAAMNKYKHDKGLIGATVPGYESNGRTKKSELEPKNEVETIIEIPRSETSRTLPPVAAETADFHIFLADADQKIRGLEKQIIQLKTEHAEETERKMAQLVLQHKNETALMQQEINRLEEVASSKIFANVSDYTADKSIEAEELQRRLDEASAYIRYLEAENDYMKQNVDCSYLAVSEDASITEKQLRTSKKIIKHLVKLL